MTYPKRRRVCCYGAGGHGRVVARQLVARDDAEVVFADSAADPSEHVDGLPIYFRELNEITGFELLVTIGDNALRSKLQSAAQGNGATLASFIADPHNNFAASVGRGTVVLAGAILNCGATIGAGVIVNSGAIVEHDCRVGDFVHISPGATLAGGCQIGREAWIGAGATIVPELVIAPNTVIGAGSAVVRDILEPGVYVGSPARRIR